MKMKKLQGNHFNDCTTVVAVAVTPADTVPVTVSPAGAAPVIVIKVVATKYFKRRPTQGHDRLVKANKM